MKIACPKCHRHLDVSEIQPGASVTCPDCRATFGRPSQLPAPGLLLNGMEVRHELKAESGCRVFSVWQADGNRMLEMKFLTSDQQSDQETVWRYLIEARLVGSVLNGYRVLSVGWDEESGMFFLTREKVDKSAPGRRQQPNRARPANPGRPGDQKQKVSPVAMFFVGILFFLPIILHILSVIAKLLKSGIFD